MALAPNTIAKSDHMLFMENGSTRGAGLAMETVRSAANAAKAAPVLIEGRADYANAVKQELVRQGARGSHLDPSRQEQSAGQGGDGVTDPTDRRVNIKF